LQLASPSTNTNDELVGANPIVSVGEGQGWSTIPRLMG